jgi:hypothetical protein
LIAGARSGDGGSDEAGDEDKIPGNAAALSTVPESRPSVTSINVIANNNSEFSQIVHNNKAGVENNKAGIAWNWVF